MDKGAQNIRKYSPAQAAVLLDLHLAGVTDVVTDTPKNWLQPQPLQSTAAPEPTPTPPEPQPPKTAPEQPAAPPPKAPSQPKTPPTETTPTLWTHGTGQKLLIFTAALPAHQGQHPLAPDAALLFSRMLAAIDLTETDVTYLACNVQYTPTADTLQAWHPHVAKELSLYNHTHILTLGKVAGNLLQNTAHPMADLRLPPLAPPTKALQKDVVCTYHPANLLKQPLLKKLAWSDLCTLKQALQQQQILSPSV